jgi:hypothetical protein
LSVFQFELLQQVLLEVQNQFWWIPFLKLF